MYISRVYLDGKKHKTVQALYNRGILHGAIERCFQGERQKSIWRLDRTGERIFLILVSMEKPDFTFFCEQFGLNGSQAEVKQYDAFISTINEGNILRFRLTANPTIKKDNKRIPLNKKKTENQSYCAMDWLIDRMKNNGAEVISAQISKYERHRIAYNGKSIVLAEATYDGCIRVMDQKMFMMALLNGIGHGKAYGCGLLTVMR